MKGRKGGSVADQGCFAGLETFLKERGDDLLREAVLLAGSRESGEELLQEAFIRILPRWNKIEDNAERYLRRTLYNLAVDRWRWRTRLREVLVADPPERQAHESNDSGLRPQILDAVALLPRHQRAVIVLRYFADASEAETAVVLGCPIGTVKSAASRGLSRLRELTQNAGVEETPRTLQESLLD
jgi:RNA polymerase sigma-70 factor (sigma-E family)